MAACRFSFPNWSPLTLLIAFLLNSLLSTGIVHVNAADESSQGSMLYNYQDFIQQALLIPASYTATRTGDTSAQTTDGATTNDNSGGSRTQMGTQVIRKTFFVGRTDVPNPPPDKTPGTVVTTMPLPPSMEGFIYSIITTTKTTWKTIHYVGFNKFYTTDSTVDVRTDCAQGPPMPTEAGSYYGTVDVSIFSDKPQTGTFCPVMQDSTHYLQTSSVACHLIACPMTQASRNPSLPVMGMSTTAVATYVDFSEHYEVAVPPYVNKAPEHSTMLSSISLTAACACSGSYGREDPSPYPMCYNGGPI